MHRLATPAMISALALTLAAPAPAQNIDAQMTDHDGVGVPAPGQQNIQTPVTNIEGTPALRYDDQTSGSLSGSYDTDDALWLLAPPGTSDLPATGWTETDDGLQVRLVGYPSASPDDMDGVLQVSFTMVGGPQERTAQEVRVTHDPMGDGPLLVAHGDGVDFNVTALQQQGDTLAIAGDIVVAVSPTPADEWTINDVSPIVIDGNFQATIVEQAM